MLRQENHFNPGGRGCSELRAEMVPLHSSLGDRERPCPRKKERETETEKAQNRDKREREPRTGREAQRKEETVRCRETETARD